MKRISLVVFGVIFIFTFLAAAASAQMSATPAPELKKLDYFSGTWSSEATIAPGPWGPGGKFSDTVTTEWMKGGFFSPCRRKWVAPARRFPFSGMTLTRKLIRMRDLIAAAAAL